MRDLAPYAVSPANSRGRRFVEEPPSFRSEFQRDRDRIIHSTAFRRLEYKTQVFVNHEGDLFRTRLTHTLEVAQIARGIARTLALNEDLAEAISLAHDLGHTPFGHAGQDALNACMRDFGGFEHNRQSLRIVDTLEDHYAQFCGLNLCYETRAGILKHYVLEPVECATDSPRALSLEAQICNCADEIAYNNHDVDDGLRSGLISIDQLEETTLFSTHISEVRARYPTLSGRALVHETTRRMINTLVCNLIQTTSAALAKKAPANLVEATNGLPLVRLSDDIYLAQQELQQFLCKNLYAHFQVLRMTSKAQRIIHELFNAFISDPRLLPPDYQEGENQARRVADYIAGMTDRYAVKEHSRLFTMR